jgi:nucleotide-binding universal stress UspA family protein
MEFIKGGGKMNNILVATDGSETANKALMETRKLAECMGSKVTIINVASDLVAHPYLMNREYGIKTNEDLKKLGKELLDEALKVFEGFPGVVETVIRSGDAGRQIIAEVEKGEYDLIVMGSRGLGAFSRAMLGSVSNKVLNHVDTNVLIIR